MTINSTGTLRWLNIVAFALMVMVNGLAGSTTFLGGKNTADISDANPTLVTPAGYVFAIWGIIYVLLGIFVIYQAFYRGQERSFQNQIGWLFVGSSALNIMWLFAWQYEYLSLSVIIMILLLATLILIYIRLDIGRAKVERSTRLAVHLPFSVYLGWITIATIGNISAMLVSLKWDGFGISPETWAVVIILIAVIIAIMVSVMRRDVAYALVVIWAFVGIYVSQSSNQTIATLLLAGAAVVAIALLVSLFGARIRSKWASDG